MGRSAWTLQIRPILPCESLNQRTCPLAVVRRRDVARESGAEGCGLRAQPGIARSGDCRGGRKLKTLCDF